MKIKLESFKQKKLRISKWHKVFCFIRYVEVEGVLLVLEYCYRRDLSPLWSSAIFYDYKLKIEEGEDS